MVAGATVHAAVPGDLQLVKQVNDPTATCREQVVVCVLKWQTEVVRPASGFATHGGELCLGTGCIGQGRGALLPRRGASSLGGRERATLRRRAGGGHLSPRFSAEAECLCCTPVDGCAS